MRRPPIPHLRMSEYLVIFERADDGGWGAHLATVTVVVMLDAMV